MTGDGLTAAFERFLRIGRFLRFFRKKEGRLLCLGSMHSENCNEENISCSLQVIDGRGSDVAFGDECPVGGELVNW